MQKKQGISLIVLVITIIVMIILAASVVITLSNTGVIDRASQAVDLTNEAQVQDMAALVWADAYMDNKRGTELVNEVTTKLGEQGVTADKWNITVTDTGVTVSIKTNNIDTPEIELLPGTAIPEGAVYYRGLTTAILGNYTGATQTLMEGELIPANPTKGDVVVYGDYEYRYDYTYYVMSAGVTSSQVWMNIAGMEGWGVVTVDKTKDKYGDVIKGIAGKDVQNMSFAFYNCKNLLVAPKIPTSVTSLQGTFDGCSALKTGPYIGENIITMNQTFKDCISLTGTLVIDANPTSYTSVFSNVSFATQKLTLSGKSDCLEEMEATGIVLDIIPTGGVYTYANGEKLEAGEVFPRTAQVNDIYTYGGYKYTCYEIPSSNPALLPATRGWKVVTTDKTKTNYGEILDRIAGYNIISLDYTFENCTNLKSITNIPTGVKSMAYTFKGCTSLIDASGIAIPSYMTELSGAFKGCTSLKTAPVIPSSVNRLEYTFEGCVALTGTITLNTTCSFVTAPSAGMTGAGYNCFANVDMSKITLAGSAASAAKQSLASTGLNGSNVTITN